MPLKPIQPSDLLRQISPRSFGKSYLSGSRFERLRDGSPASQRSRSPSTKRKLDMEVSYASVVGTNSDVHSQAEADALELLDVNTAKVSTMCTKVATDLENCSADPRLVSIMTDLCEAVSILGKSVADMRSKPTILAPGAPAKKQRQTGMSSSHSLAVLSRAPARTQEEPESDPELRKFKDAVKEAEKSTLIFNLDMGKVPILNKETMCRKATLSLLGMAAQKEGKNSQTPSDEAISAIDNALSMSKGMEFFGNTTKTYTNSKDAASGSFCTIPVRYNFDDKDTRIRVEQSLRERCKVQCSTPYPIILRECIKKTIVHVKQAFPSDFIRVNVDANSMSLKVARRPKDSAEWVYYQRDVGLPPEVLNVTTRVVPKDLVLTNLPGTGGNDSTPTNGSSRGRQSARGILPTSTATAMEGMEAVPPPK